MSLSPHPSLFITLTTFSLISQRRRGLCISWIRCLGRRKKHCSAFSVHSSGHPSDRDMVNALITVPATEGSLLGCRVLPQSINPPASTGCAVLEYTGHSVYTVWNCFWAHMWIFFPFSFVGRCHMLNATKAISSNGLRNSNWIKASWY